MNEELYKQYRRLSDSPSTIRAIDCIPYFGSRTLVYGYDLDRTTVHVWLEVPEDPQIGVIRYTEHDGMTIEFREVRPEWPVDMLAPSKRAYPESTDYNFAVLMKDRGAPLSFTTPDYESDAKRKRIYRPFAGPTR